MSGLRDALQLAHACGAQIEYHPYVFKASQPILDIQKEHRVVTTSYGGLSPITRSKGGPLDPVLEKIAKRVSEASGKQVTSGQVLQLWLRKKSIVCVTCVHILVLVFLC